MSIRKTVVTVRLAVAALAVAGVVGTVWAQGSPVTGASSVAANKMIASFTQNSLATITVTNNTPSEADFKKYTAGADYTARLKGNLGTITVNCNTENWDVVLTTSNGGRLRLPKGTGGTLGAALRKADGDDTKEIILGLELGIFKTGNARLLDTIPKDWIMQSNESWGPIAFSQVIGQNAYSKNNTDRSTDSTAVYQDIGGDRTIAIATAGANSVKNKGFGAPNNTGNTITFLVNGGLELGAAGKLRGNANGVYTDTLKFTLISGY